MTPTEVRISDYPQLRAIAWHLAADTVITEQDALRLYERNWRHVGELTDDEARFVQHLADTYSGGRLLV
ncbi:hypothetical protein HH308_14100 [Gordonia sp. TBRC 11910]|uniref:Uncharacterized protein n=1 Tax=Gordonia asplenii TaxID=2725283 RepID=A0A848KWA3_9ACTN|nr:hypothetical protein [Gordonia asplenii]NMO02347.1 hypothetical protein [Gordonia asplenii]